MFHLRSTCFLALALFAGCTTGKIGGNGGSPGEGGEGGPSSTGAAGMGGPGVAGAGMSGPGVAGMVGPGSAGMSGAGTAGTGGPPPSNLPVITSFKSDPGVLPAGGGSATLSWQVTNATSVSIDHGIGTVTGTSATVNVTASTIYTLTATNSNGSVTAVTAIGTGQNPARGSAGRSVAMVSPNSGEQFTAPSRLRLVASARDPNVFTNSPTEGHGGNAASVQFFVDDQMVLAVDGLSAEYWVFKGFADNIPAGQHRVWLRAIYTNPAEQLDSLPAIITVAAPPAYASTVNLTADVVVGSAGYSQIGTPGGRIRLNGNGYRIITSGSTSGAVTLQHVDLFNLGSPTQTSQSGIDMTTTGAVTIEDCNFDNSNTVKINFNGAATASIKRNTFRSNMRMPLGQQPVSPTSYPVLSFGGSGTGAKVFAGNNVGAGWLELLSARNWVIGGDTDADSNVFIGPRVGITVSSSQNIQVRRNYSHHVYYGGWSQGANFELQGSPMITVEHNVIYGSSWPVRGAGCEFRYNLVVSAGHEWLWPEPNGSIHHNVFVGGENDVGGIFLTYNHSGIKVFNNTIDGLEGWKHAVAFQMGNMSLTSNAFVNVPSGTTVSITGGSMTTDYNFFDRSQSNYSDSRKPAHDLVASQAMLMSPPTRSFDLDEAGIWTRGTSTASVLKLYRTRYQPMSGSPLIDAGDPAGGAGNDIGAVGAGTANANDKFGVLP